MSEHYGPAYDVVVIGAGVLGTAVAARLATTTASVCLLEEADDVAEGSSKGNAGIATTFYAPPGTLEAYQKCIDVAPNGPYAAQAKAALDGLTALEGGDQPTIGKRAKKKS